MAYTANLNTQNLQLPKDSEAGIFTDAFNYSNSKLCNLITANGFAKLLREDGVTANSTNPGLVTTPIYTYAIKTNNISSVYSWLLYKIILKQFGKVSMIT